MRRIVVLLSPEADSGTRLPRLMWAGCCPSGARPGWHKLPGNVCPLVGVEEVNEAQPVVGDCGANAGVAHNRHADVKVEHGSHADSHRAQGTTASTVAMRSLLRPSGHSNWSWLDSLWGIPPGSLSHYMPMRDDRRGNTRHGPADKRPPFPLSLLDKSNN